MAMHDSWANLYFKIFWFSALAFSWIFRLRMMKPLEEVGGVSDAFVCETARKEKWYLHHQVVTSTIIPIILH